MSQSLGPRVLLFGLAVALILAGCSGGPPVKPSVRAPGPSEVVSPSPRTTARGRTPGPRIVLVVEENHTFGEIIGSREAPSINELAGQGVLLTSYHAITHPSLPNYLAMLAGTTGGIRSDCTSCTVRAATLVDQLETAGISWQAYLPGLPVACSAVAAAGAYAKKHNPFLYFPSIRDEPARCGHVVPFDRFTADTAAGRLPRFVFISPDLQHDMHDGSIRTADTWLRRVYDQLRHSPAWREDTRLVVTFDEGRHGDNHVAAIVVGPRVRPDRDDTRYTHYSLLRSIEAAFDLPYLGHARTASPIPVLARR